MRYTGKTWKKIAALISAGIVMIASNDITSAEVIKPFVMEKEDEDPLTNQNNSNDNLLKKIQEPEIESAKEELQRQFVSGKLEIDGKFNGIISGIRINGKKIEIELKNNEKINGEYTEIHLSNITLNYLNVYDEYYIEESIENIFRSERKQVKIEASGVKVLGEFRMGKLGCIDINKESIDISNCRFIWKDSQDLTTSDIETYNNNIALEKLILTNITAEEYGSGDGVLKLENNTIKTFIASFFIPKNYYSDFDLNGCPNLEIVSIGTNIGCTNLNGIKDCTKLKVLNLGALNWNDESTRDIINDSFKDEEEKIEISFDTSSEAVSYNDGNLISDMNDIKNKTNIKVLNISFVEYVTSDQFLEVVKTLPNLKEIVGKLSIIML